MDSPLFALWKSPFGWLGIVAHEHGLLRVTVPRSTRAAARADIQFQKARAGENEHIRAALAELGRYFACDPLADFQNVQLDMSCGTPFERAVWQRVRAIPLGETRTYGEIARVVGHPNAARAVGACNAKNPWAILVPCHRLIGANGGLVGYGGGLAIKKRLLALEKGMASRRNEIELQQA